jgi:hypothetical protein
MEKEEHALRIRITYSLYRKFKVLCASKDLSIPKQVEELIRHFVQIQEENDRRMPKEKK